MIKLKNRLGFKHYFITLSIVFTTFQISCKDDWFDEKSDKNLTVPSTLQDFEYLLDNYNAITTVSPALGEIASDGHYMSESRWQTLPLGANTTNVQKNAYTWTNDYLYENVRDWNLNYAKIFQCNLVLDGLSKIDRNVEVKRYNQVKGNALFQRAKSYFDLAQIYGQVYNQATATVDLGIPLQTGIDITIKPTRSTVWETYSFIVKDLMEAAEILPLQTQYLTRGSKLACYALLARTFLAMGNYEKAAAYADSVLKDYNKLIDFNKISITNSNLGIFNDEVLFHSQMINYQFSYDNGYIFIDNGLYDRYHSDDLRKTRFFSITTNGIVFKGMYNNGRTQFSGLATDEMYLIRAESYARLGNLAAAMKDLNDLLRTRWAKNSDGSTKYVDQVTEDELTALNIILSERYKELLLRGTRWTDLRRLNQDDRFKVTLSRTIGGKTYILEPNSYKYTFPIPDDEMAYSGISQNPGWER